MPSIDVACGVDEGFGSGDVVGKIRKKPIPSPSLIKEGSESLLFLTKTQAKTLQDTQEGSKSLLLLP